MLDKKKADLIKQVEPIAKAIHPQPAEMSDTEWFDRLWKFYKQYMGDKEAMCVGFANMSLSELMTLWNAILATAINRWNKANEKIMIPSSGGTQNGQQGQRKV